MKDFKTTVIQKDGKDENYVILIEATHPMTNFHKDLDLQVDIDRDGKDFMVSSPYFRGDANHVFYSPATTDKILDPSETLEFVKEVLPFIKLKIYQPEELRDLPLLTGVYNELSDLIK